MRRGLLTRRMTTRLRRRGRRPLRSRRVSSRRRSSRCGRRRRRPRRGSGRRRRWARLRHHHRTSRQRQAGERRALRDLQRRELAPRQLHRHRAILSRGGRDRGKAEHDERSGCRDPAYRQISTPQHCGRVPPACCRGMLRLQPRRGNAHRTLLVDTAVCNGELFVCAAAFTITGSASVPWARNCSEDRRFRTRLKLKLSIRLGPWCGRNQRPVECGP